MNVSLSFFDNLKKLQPILAEIKKDGGVSYLVGGSVRDLLLGIKVKDIDIEVHKISLQKLQDCLKKFGQVKLVGKQFGVLRINKLDIDWSLPRKDSVGRKPKVEIDSNMTIEQACKRRDLTINSMAIDLNKLFLFRMNKKDIEIIDPFGGQKDLKDKILRAVDNELFLQDPLRFFRVMQFIGRFEMRSDENLNELCKNIKLTDIQTGCALSKERIFEEIKKLFLKSKKPSLGFRWLKDIGRLKEIFPELYDLIGVEQRKDYHPEGDVFEHTMQAVDAAAMLDKYENDDEKFAIMLGVLCHDLGKPKTTDKDLHCTGHEKEGVDIAKKFLKRFVQNKELIKFICKLVLYHTMPALLFKQKSGLKAYKRLAAKLAPNVNLRQLGLVSLCDIRGRNPKSHEPLEKTPEIFEKGFDNFIQQVKESKVEYGAEKPVLLGRDLLDLVGAGPELGKLVKRAYQIQIDEDITDVEVLKKRVLDSIDQ